MFSIAIRSGAAIFSIETATQKEIKFNEQSICGHKIFV